VTKTFFKRVPPPKYTPSLVTDRPEYVKEKWGECKVCPERIRSECERRTRSRPAMPMMCELYDSLDCLALGIEPSEILTLERRSPATGRFEKGNIPWNVGISSFDPNPGTHFKKGCVPQNKLAVGTEVETKGYIRRKVAEPKVWRQRSHIIWEEHHGRPLPEGWIVRHKDGDKLNDDPHNLEAMPRNRNLAETLKDPVVMQRKKDGTACANRGRWKKYRDAQGKIESR